MARRDVLIRLPLTEGEASEFEGRNAMVVPLSDFEVVELRDKIILSHDGMTELAGALATLTEVLETKSTSDPEIRKLLAQWRDPSRLMASHLERVRELLGRAKFVSGPDSDNGVSQ